MGRMLNHHRLAAVALAACGLGACQLSTARPDVLSHHLLARPVPPLPAPPAGSTPPPLYIVGIEKFDANLVGRIPTVGQPDCRDPLHCFDPGAGPTGRERLWEDALSDRTQMVVSHIVEITGVTCRPVAPRPEIATCPEAGYVQRDPPVAESWRVLEEDFYQELKEAIGERATHVIVMAPGWNSSQEKSVRIFRAWASGLSEELGPDAAPIFIGISWPAARRGLPLIHFFNKAHDSDEAGFTWGNVLVNRVLARLRDEEGVRVVLLGHSFGARLLSSAAFSGFAIGAPCQTAGPDLLIGLQAAYSTSRFIGPNPPDAEVFHHAPDCRGVAAFTASTHDTAVAVAPSQWLSSNSGYMGGAAGLRAAAGDPMFAVTTADVGGQAALPPERHVVMVDATAFVTEHGDIEDDAIFNLVGSLIRTYAPAAPTR